jgi:cytochrome P450
MTLRRLPAPFPLGHLATFRGDRLGLLEQVAAAGDLVETRVGIIRPWFVSSPALAEELLVTRAADYKKSRGIGIFAKPLIGDGILSSHGEVHRRNRRLVAPAFHHKKIAGYAQAMAEEIAAVIAQWQDGERLDVAHEMMRLTLRVVARVLFHTEVERDAETIGEAFVAASRAMLDMTSSTLPFPPVVPTEASRRMRRAVAELDAIVFRIIGERRAGGDDPGDVLSMLLAMRDEETGAVLSDREVRDEVMTLFLAGHETTANALTWSWYLLGRHPEALARLEVEAQALEGPPRFEDLPRLPFAMAVLNESMRLFPPAYITGRLALVDSELGGEKVERGRTVFLNIYGIHRRADTFPDPLAFRPERFLGGAEKNLPRGAWIPFGGGPRICIGNHFALTEGVLALAAIAQRVRLVPESDAPAVAEPLITLRPRDPIWMRVRERAQRSPSIKLTRRAHQAG